MAEVAILDVTKEFPGEVAVSHLTITADDGEFLIFVGPSGCGKTTAFAWLPASTNRRRARSIAAIAPSAEGHRDLAVSAGTLVAGALRSGRAVNPSR